MLTFEQIKELIELVEERELGGLEIERAGFRLKIEGHRAPPMVATPQASAAPVAAMPAPAPAPAAPSVSQQQSEVTAAEPELPEDTHVVTSPIVGTFYASPSPDASPYAKVGDRVEAGQVLCIIEAMKLMNEIESDVSGVVLAIYPKNAQAVEFGEPLFAIGSG